MKLLKFKVEGLPLFKDNFEVDFTCRSKVYERDYDFVSEIKGHVYRHNTIAFTGLNASGKTSILRLIFIVFGILNNEQINNIAHNFVLGCFEGYATFEIYYLRENLSINKLVTQIECRRWRNGVYSYRIVDEKIWTKKINSKTSQVNIWNFTDDQIYSRRADADNYLQDDCSIIIKQNKENSDTLPALSTIPTTVAPLWSIPQIADYDPNKLKIIVPFLDPTIEVFRVNKTPTGQSYDIKFYGSEPIHVSDNEHLQFVLSSGTIKGIPLLMVLFDILDNGGYLLIDEIENHFNKEITQSLIRFFNSVNTNKKGSTLIFSTHYPEILDELPRTDSIYISDNIDKIGATCLSTHLSRNDIKKSDAIISGYIPYSAPSYESYRKLQVALGSIGA